MIRFGIFFGIMFLGLFPQIVFAIDTDMDGLTDEQEAFFSTNSTLVDTDGDGFSDFVEIEHGYSPHTGGGLRLHQFDHDKDGLHDWAERWFQTSMGVADSDGDGTSDFDEIMKGKNPLSAEDGSIRLERRIVVDRTLQRLYYYVDQIKVLDFPVSTGNPQSETPAGEFTIERMIDVKRYVGPGYDLAGVKWNMQFKPMYYIHAAYWHNDFGKRTHSHGCVNMTEKDSGLLYKYMDVGIPVIVEGTTPKRYAVGT